MKLQPKHILLFEGFIKEIDNVKADNEIKNKRKRNKENDPDEDRNDDTDEDSNNKTDKPKNIKEEFEEYFKNYID